MNAEKEKELVKLIDEASRFCEVYLNYKPATVAGYRKAWFNILDFMTIYGLDSLDKKSQIKFWDKLNWFCVNLGAKVQVLCNNIP